MKPDTPDLDSQQELKKSARRRLIGAAFFVIIAAAVLPMIMDAAPPPQLNDFRIVTAEERAATNAPATPISAPVPPVLNDSAPPAPSPTPALDSKPSETQPAAPVVVAAEPKAEPVAAPVVSEKKPEPVKSVEKPAAEKKETKDTAQYYIQVGVFADAENVKQARAKLKAQGISSWTEEATGNLAGKTRVKAGPFPTREAADKALAKITKAGMNGMIAKK